MAPEANFRWGRDAVFLTLLVFGSWLWPYDSNSCISVASPMSLNVPSSMTSFGLCSSLKEFMHCLGSSRSKSCEHSFCGRPKTWSWVRLASFMKSLLWTWRGFDKPLLLAAKPLLYPSNWAWSSESISLKAVYLCCCFNWAHYFSDFVSLATALSTLRDLRISVIESSYLI